MSDLKTRVRKIMVKVSSLEARMAKLEALIRPLPLQPIKPIRPNLPLEAKESAKLFATKIKVASKKKPAVKKVAKKKVARKRS